MVDPRPFVCTGFLVLYVRAFFPLVFIPPPPDFFSLFSGPPLRIFAFLPFSFSPFFSFFSLFPLFPSQVFPTIPILFILYLSVSTSYRLLFPPPFSLGPHTPSPPSLNNFVFSSPPLFFFFSPLFSLTSSVVFTVLISPPVSPLQGCFPVRYSLFFSHLFPLTLTHCPQSELTSSLYPKVKLGWNFPAAQIDKNPGSPPPKTL